MKNLLPALLFAVSGGYAHDMYILPEKFAVQPNTKLTVAFHNGDAFPESEVSTKPERLQDGRIILKGKRVPLQDIRIVETKTVATLDVPDAKGTAIVSVQTKPNFIELAPEKFLSYLKEEGLTETIDWRQQHGESTKPGRERYSKYAKSLVVVGSPDDSYRQALGFPIEILLEGNPAKLHAGDKLPVRVMFRGKPEANIQVEVAWADDGKKDLVVVGRTDSQGRIAVPLRAAGMYRLHSLKMERCAEPAVADWESFWASFTFDVR